MIGLKDSRYFFIQSEVKPKPIVTRSHELIENLLRNVYSKATNVFIIIIIFFFSVMSNQVGT